MIPNQVQPLISEMVNRIVAGFDPEEIILFGSQARGEAGKDSDVDLAVIFSSLPGRHMDRAVEIHRCLHGMGISKDIIVLTRQDYEEQKPWVGTIGRIVARDGKVLYKKAES